MSTTTIAPPARTSTLTPWPDFADDPARGCATGKARPDDFFAEGSTAQRKVIEDHCAGCPVGQACRDWAVTTGQQHGVWGGLTVRQLHAAVARQRRGLEPEPVTMPTPTPPTLDEQVAELHRRGMSDKDIAAEVGVWKSTVRNSRNRQGLPVLYGPGGQRLHRAVPA